MFENRAEAGRILAKKLLPFKGEDTVVLAIPRGGVVIGRVIADYLECPLDVLIVKKLRAPDNPELAIGAVVSGGVVYWDKGLIKALQVDEDYKNKELRIKKLELEEREKYLKREGGKINLFDKTVVLTDDGIATGATVLVAITAVRTFRPKKVVLAVPVIAENSLNEVRMEVDDLIYIETPSDFHAVGQFYKIFDQISDEEVKLLINSSRYRKDVL